MTERHEVRVRGAGQTIVFVADSADGRLIIRQEPDGSDPSEVCAISLSNSDELRAFFQGLRRVIASLGQPADESPSVQPKPSRALPQSWRQPSRPNLRPDDPDREAVVAKARTRNPQAFTPWTREEEEEIRQRHAQGESLQSIARARRRSPRAIELRLQRLGVIPPEE
jgi:hypothetical protein